jgi:hypothetical protein
VVCAPVHPRYPGSASPEETIRPDGFWPMATALAKVSPPALIPRTLSSRLACSGEMEPALQFSPPAATNQSRRDQRLGNLHGLAHDRVTFSRLI